MPGFGAPSLVQLDLLPTDRVIDMVAEGVDVALRTGGCRYEFHARKIGRGQAPDLRRAAYLGATARRSGPEDLRAQLHRLERARLPHRCPSGRRPRSARRGERASRGDEGEMQIIWR